MAASLTGTSNAGNLETGMENNTLDDNEKKPTKVEDDVVVGLDYTLTVDGQVINSTKDEDPLQYIQGHKNIIPGLEQSLYGMQVGQSKEVTVDAKNAYGEQNPEALIEVPRSEFPPEIPMEQGVQLQVRDMSGQVQDARIEKVGSDSVTLDFNHPLAGKDLHFDVTIASLRPATEEELEHGHVHGDVDEDEEDFEYEDEDEEEGLYEDDEEVEDLEEDEVYDAEDELEEEGFYIEDEDEENEDLNEDLKNDRHKGK